MRSLFLLILFLTQFNAVAQRKKLPENQQADLIWIASMFTKYADSNYLNENKEAWQQQLIFIKETGLLIIKQRQNNGLAISNGNWQIIDTVKIKKIKRCIENYEQQTMTIYASKNSISSLNANNIKKPTKKSVSIIHIRIGLERNMVKRMETKFLALKPYY